MIANNFLRQARSSQISNSIRGYISRAHPPKEGKPSFPIADALSSVLTGVEERKVKRQEKWDRNAETRVAKGIKVSLLDFDVYYPTNVSLLTQCYLGGRTIQKSR